MPKNKTILNIYILEDNPDYLTFIQETDWRTTRQDPAGNNVSNWTACSCRLVSHQW